MASESPAITTAQVGHWKIQTNDGSTPEALAERHAPKPDVDTPEPTEEDKVSTAASELGKLGGKAAAKAKAKAAKEVRKAERAAATEQASKSENVGDSDDEKASEQEAGASSEAKDEKPLGKPRDDPRARMLEATRKESEAKKALAEERERHAEEMREIREEIRALRESRERPAVEREADAAPDRPRELKKPTPEEFDDYEKYLDARDDYNRRSWVEEQEKKSRANEVNKALQTAHEKFKAAIEDVWPTIKETVGRLNPTFNMPPGAPESGGNWIANFLFFNPENARALALYLHEHEDELQRLAALTSPHAVSRELGKIEARIEAAATDTSPVVEPQVPKAAPPVKPVSGAPSIAAGSGYRQGMSLDEYARIWKPKGRR